MIFFNVPSVGQLKPKTFFGENENHYGFIQSVVGEEYNAQSISQFCNDYYFKPKDVEYWGRIITLIRFAGLRKLNSSKIIMRIPLLDFIQKEYDKQNIGISNIWLNYFLCMWQHPHPSLEKKEDQRNFPIFKPYAMVLAILIELYKKDSSLSYLTNDEFYWLGYSYHKKLFGFNLNKAGNIADKILDLRNNDGWQELNNIPHYSVHLSYPKGFLNNSSILTTNSNSFKIPNGRKLFIGLLPGVDDIVNIVNQLINFSASHKFSFDANIKYTDIELEAKFSDYLHNYDLLDKWVKSTGIFDYTDITDAMIDIEPFDDSEYLYYKEFQAKKQLERLSILDREVKTRYRTEQKILRDFLFKADYGVCGICNKKYPAKFCACAHIKKRSKCTDEEKKDLNVVMPACYFGCDSLYEKGYIKIENGVVMDNHFGKTVTKQIEKYLNEIKGNQCKYFNDDSKKYFLFHNNNI